MKLHFAALALATALAAGCAPKEEPVPTDSDPVIAGIKQKIHEDSMNWQLHAQLSDELRRKDRAEEAAQAAAKAFEVAPAPGIEARLTMAKVFAATDRSASAINLVKEAEKRKKEGVPVDEVKIAEVYGVLGDNSAVFRWLERAVIANSPNVATLHTNPDLQGAKDDPRWASIVPAQ